MTINHWWQGNDSGTGALGTFNDAPPRALSDFSGKRFAVDASIFLNKFLRSDVDKLSSTCSPPYICPDLFQKFIEFHQMISKDIIPVYVFDGVAPCIKNRTKMERKIALERQGKPWLDLVARANENGEEHFTEDEIKEATVSRMKMKKPTALDHANLISWMRKEGIKCIGSLLEADQQMVKLERDKKVDGIITEDGDIVALGGKLVLSKLKMKKNAQYECKAFVYDEFMQRSNPFQSKICMYPDIITHIALLLGNDYNKKVENNGEVCVLGKREKPSDKKSPRMNNGMVDRLAASSDMEDWINSYGTNGNSPLTEEKKDEYWRAYRFMLHAPVIEECPLTGVNKIVPLNPLPDGSTEWVEYLGSDYGLGEVMSDDEDMLMNIYNCNILPLERQSLQNYTGPHNRDNSAPAALFETLFFEDHKLAIQPKMCIINWLRARGLDARFGDSLQELRDNVIKCERLDRHIKCVPLQPLVGTHNAYVSIRSRTANNSLDNWSTEYLSVAKKLGIITDDAINGYLGVIRAGRPSIRFRAMKLIKCGHFHPKSIKCRNMMYIKDGSPCIMLVCDCLSSTTSVVHRVYSVFQDKPGGGGSFLRELSSCSCKKGEDFCSHSIGFLFIISLLQRCDVTTQSYFESKYHVSPLLVQGALMLIENVVAPDLFRKQKAQRKRQVEAKLSASEKRARLEDSLEYLV